MTRRLLACPLVALVALVLPAQPGAAQVVGNPGDATITVYPLGIAPTDAENVQEALDNVASPGTVVMKATDMGGTGWRSISAAPPSATEPLSRSPARTSR